MACALKITHNLRICSVSIIVHSPMPARFSAYAVRSILALHLVIAPRLPAQEGKRADDRPIPIFATIHGKISLPRKDDSHQVLMRGHMLGMYSMHGGGEASVSPDPVAGGAGNISEKAAVYLESEELDQAPYPVPAKVPSLDQRNLQFHPQVLPVMVGTRVDFPNRDNLFHNVFSYSQAKDFDLGRYPKDDSRSVTFDRPGVVRVYCDIHAHMRATILVLKHPYYASPDASGEYVIPRIPPGKYRVVLWYDREAADRKTIQLRGGENLQVDFTNQGPE
jgi:plastocyanin